MNSQDPANSIPRERLMELIGELCNGSISDSAGRELDAALCASPQARALYTNYMWMHGSLYGDAGELHQGLPEFLGVDSAPGESPAEQFDIHGEQVRRQGRERRRHEGPGRSAANWLTLAAALAGVAVLSSALTRAWQQREVEAARDDAVQSEPDAGAAAGATAVARITGTRNCIWADENNAVSYGSLLATGQRLELKEGLAEVTFDDGATLLLEGPASFVVAGGDRLQLDEGRLAGIVPERARKFRVHTAALDVWEAGAEFGLVAQASGSTEVHVFNGLVRASVLDGDGHAFEQLELGGAQAARVNPVATSITEFPADDAQFVRSLAPTSGPHDGLLAYEGFRYPDGPLEAQNGGFGWAGPWFNISVDQQAGPESNRVTLGSLAVEGIVPVGNHAAQTAQENRIRRSLATSVGGVFDASGLVENQDGVRLVGRDGKQVYISFLQRVSQVDDGFYGVELHRSDGNSNRVLCIGNGADGAGYGATSNVNVYGAANLPALGAENSEVNLIVIKITYGVANRDVVHVYRNPESLRDESLCKPDAMLRGNFAFDRISLGNFDGTKVHEVDELRVGTHYLAVTGRWGSNPERLQRRIAFHHPQQFRLVSREGQVALTETTRHGAADRAGGDRS